MHLKGVIGNNGHRLLRSGDLHHVESGARLKSPRRVKFVDGFGLEVEPRSKSYVDAMIGTPSKVSFEVRGRFGLVGDILKASAKSTKCEDNGLIIQANAQGVVSNTRRSSVFHGDDATKKVNVVDQGCIGKARKVLINAKECTKEALKCALNEVRHKGKDNRTKHKAAVERQSLLKAPLYLVELHMAQSNGLQQFTRIFLFCGPFSWDPFLLILGYSKHMGAIYMVLNQV